MLLIDLVVIAFNVFKTKLLECVSMINQNVCRDQRLLM